MKNKLLAIRTKKDAIYSDLKSILIDSYANLDGKVIVPEQDDIDIFNEIYSGILKVEIKELAILNQLGLYVFFGAPVKKDTESERMQQVRNIFEEIMLDSNGLLVESKIDSRPKEKISIWQNIHTTKSIGFHVKVMFGNIASYVTSDIKPHLRSEETRLLAVRLLSEYILRTSAK